jgi:hypothetical protein
MMEFAEVFGIPVVQDAKSKSIADSRGFWPFKKITVGNRWLLLSPREQWAVVLHEAKHCLAFHPESRWLLIPVFWTRWARELTHRQEYAADAFVVDHGYGVDLLRFLVRSGPHSAEKDPFHPSPAERAHRVSKLLKERVNVQVAA